MTPASRATRDGVARSIAEAPIIGVVRTDDTSEAARQARAFRESGLELIEITFTVPAATDVVRELLEERGADGPPWFGMGTVTSEERARAAVGAGSEFVVTPNLDADVARLAGEAGLFLVLGALTATEIVTASRLGADLVKVYPLPPVGGPLYLSTVRQPLSDIPMLAAGGFGPEEIPAYRRAGAIAFGLGAQLLGAGAVADRQRVATALASARGGGGARTGG